MRSYASDTACWLLSHDGGVLITKQLPSLSFSLIHCKLSLAFQRTVGVAVATVQFFAIGIKAIRLGKQICASKTGSTEANEALEISLRAISDIRKDLRHSITRDANSNIAKTQQQCLEVAEKLLKVLESIKASSQTAKSKFLKDLSATWQVIRARSKIDKLGQELQVAQTHFKEKLTVETRNAIAQVLENQGNDITVLQSLWDEIQQLSPELQQARKENNASHQETLSVSALPPTLGPCNFTLP